MDNIDTQVEEVIKEQVEKAIRLVQDETRKPARNSWTMLANRGAVGMLVHLMMNPSESIVQSGFKALYRAGLLHECFESIVIRHKDIFDSIEPQVVVNAQWRLERAEELCRDL